MKKSLKLVFVFSVFLGGRHTAFAQPQPVQLLLENHPTADAFYYQNSFTELNGKYYFANNNFGVGNVYQTDGSTEGTVAIPYDQNEAQLNSIYNIISFNNKLLVFDIYFPSGQDYGIGLEPGFFDPIDGTITLLKDINQTNNEGSTALAPYLFNEKVLFLANDGTTGSELWMTDGTETGTNLLKEVMPDQEGINSILYKEFQGKLFFVVNNKQIWKTDGTSEGTVIVKDLSGANGYIAYDGEKDLVESNGKLYFRFYSNLNNRYQLWQTDGTEIGTVQTVPEGFYNVVPRSVGGELIVFINFNERGVYKLNQATQELDLLMTVGDGNDAIYRVFRPFSEIVFFNTKGKLWKTDGTDVILVKEIPGLQNGNFEAQELNDEIIFFAESDEYGYEPWRTNGTEEGTTLIKDINPSYFSGGLQYIGGNDTHIYFIADDGQHGRELWASDGTSEGTYLINDYSTRPKDLKLGSIAKTPSQLVLAEDNNYFAAPNLYTKSEADQLELLSNPSGNPTFSHFDHLVTYEDNVYTFTSEGVKGQIEYTGLVKISNNQIEVIKEITSGSNLQVIGDKMLFTSDPIETQSREMWVSDGTANGTYELTDIAPGASDAFNYGEAGGNEGFIATQLGSNVFFSANDQTNGFELWSSDMTSDGTTLVVDINPGPDGSNPRNFKLFGTTFFFLANNSAGNPSIWRSNGTSGGTNQLIEFTNEVKTVEYHATSQTLFFSIAFSNNTYSLYKTSGTPETTEFLADAGSYYYNGISPFAGFGNKVLFVTQDFPDNYYNIYSDTGDPTNVYTGYFYPDGTFVVDELLYLSVGNNYLYSTDGSSDSFDLVYDFFTNGGLNQIRELIPVGEELYFNARKNLALTPWVLRILYSSVELEYNGVRQSSTFEMGFAETVYSESSVKQLFKISNTGYTPLKFTGSVTFDLAGPNHEDFELDLSGISNKINPNKSGEIGITFTPKGIGPRSATLLILTNDEENPLIEIALTGTGTKADPTISFAELPAKSILDEPFDLTASVDTDQEISFSSSNPEIASIQGKTVTIHKAGTVTITASVVETELYNAASKQQSLTINGVEQTITFEALPEKTFGDSPFDLSATASSGLDVTFSSSDASVASVEGVTVSILKAGAVTITASQAGNDNYSSATATQSLTINKAAQTITFATLPAKTFGDASFELSASSTSGLTVAYASNDATVAKVDGTTVTILKPGSVTVTASQTGNENYLAAASVEQSLVVNKAGQTITFEPLAAKTYGDPAFELLASSSIGLPIAFSSSDPAVVSVEGNSASIVKAGAVTITASQAGNDNYNAASAEQTLAIAKAAQTITFDELPTLQSNDAPIALVAEASSGLPVAFQSEDETIATLEGATLTITGSGTTSITATQGGDENYLAAAEVTRALVVEEVTGLNELAALIKVYPNPTESFIAIELPENITQVSYVLTFTTGQQVKEGRLLSQSGKVEIPFDGMPTGTYLLTLTNGELSSTWRILKN
ncbi:T9SS type A sorting domain-containing protein [Imperialibacter roseus]|uniref:T9SS type A sorting domain-containing protein n=1 Tax=Imperialibacter roseus TaxID=1324217 RepID=A0ABZ0ILY4_9BACT|nr:T9SS type A sorting domain-containing protein [Imperialibacter roseus]WOK06043.1 T9SS type A sorting domain-containing protein [Imperialibacter roseus]